MSTDAISIRDAILSRIIAAAPQPYETTRKVYVPIAQPDDLPLLTVSVLREMSARDGEGYVQLQRDITIGISVVRGFEDPLVLEGQMDDEIAFIEATLFTDPSFVRKSPDALFSSIEQVNCSRVFPQNGETHYVELRLDMTFRVYSDFETFNPDDFKRMVVDTKPSPSSGATPLIRSQFDQDTD